MGFPMVKFSPAPGNGASKRESWPNLTPPHVLSRFHMGSRIGPVAVKPTGSSYEPVCLMPPESESGWFKPYGHGWISAVSGGGSSILLLQKESYPTILSTGKFGGFRGSGYEFSSFSLQ